MKFAKIKFDSRGTFGKALTLLMRRCRVVGLRDHVLIVPDFALEWLTSENIPHNVIEWLHQDDVVQTLRSNLAHTA